MILLLGKTCSGKDTILRELVKMGMERVVTYTTRPPRKGEVDGETYHFVSKDDFLQKKKDSFFAETTSYRVANNGGTWHYGSALEDLSKDKAMIVNPSGLKQLRLHKSLDIISFYIVADDYTIAKRLIKRGDDDKEAERRYWADQRDFSDIYNYVDFAVRNVSIKPKLVAEIIMDTYRKVKGD